MAEERNTRREILRKILTLGPLAALAGAFGGNGARRAEAATYNEDVIINDPYKLGIGTTSPGGKLTIDLPAAGEYSAIYARRAGLERFALNVNAGDGGWSLYDFSDVASWTRGITQKWGNVGIGTTNPGPAKITIDGPQGEYNAIVARGGGLERFALMSMPVTADGASGTSTTS